MVWQFHNLMGGIVPVFVLLGGIHVAGAEETVPVERTATDFVGNYCAACHSADDPEGGVNLEDLAADFANPKTAGQWRHALEQVVYTEMPPEEADDFPSTRERQAFVAALETELSRHGQGFGLDEKMLLPEFGNLVDHKKLFSGEIQEKPYTPARLWRQRPDIYRRIWGRNYGTKHWLSIKIGGNHQATARNRVQHGPHKGKSISGRYFAQERFANPFYEYVHHASGFTDYATIAADQASLESLLTNAEAMAEILTVGIPVMIHTEVKSKDSVHGNNHGSFVGGVATVSHERTGKIPTAFKRIVDNDSVVSKDDFQQALKVAFELFLRRAPREEDIEHYWEKVFLKNVELGNTEALQAVLIYVAISPEFVYRMEMGLGEKDEHDRRMLSPQELVYALHYALENTPAFGVDEIETDEVYQKNSDPLVKQYLTNSRTSLERHSWLVEQMREGKLKTRDDVEAAVRELLGGREGNLQPNHNSPIQSVKNPRILQFFREYFGYHKASTVFKDVDQFTTRDGFQQFHKHTPHRMMYDTDWLILHVLQEDKDVLYELLTTNKVFVSYWSGETSPDQVKKAGGREKYVAKHNAQSYNLDPFEHEYDRRSPLLVPPEQRCGVLTQPSWLVAHSGNFDNDPVRRGKWIREKLLAGTVIDVPITVDAQVPDDETQTLRQRYSVVREAYCWRCHRKMNPLGMPFEAYNHVGRYRSLEKGKPVDTSGTISHSNIGQLDGEVKDVREMMERLARFALGAAIVSAAHVRYWMGRNEMLSDSQTLIAMDKAYVESGGSFNETLVALLTSDSFLYRK